MRSFVTLSMIVKDEAKTLPRCLRAVLPFVDKLFITDTGSTDDTIAIAKAFGARVFKFRWVDDFSAARNYALAWVDTPWVMTLDADDIVLNPWNIKPLIEDSARQQATCLMSQYLSTPTLTIGRPQIVRSEMYRFMGAVHESFQPVKHPDKHVLSMTDLKIYHNKPLERAEPSARKYLDIMLAKDPTNYLGIADAHRFLKQHEAAYEHYVKALGVESINDETRYMCLFEGAREALNLAKQEPDWVYVVLELLEKAIAFEPSRAEAYTLLGTVFVLLKDRDKAILSFKEALSKEEPKHPVGAVYREYYRRIPKAGLERLAA